MIQHSEENQVIIICRLPCLNQKSFNDLQWDNSNWISLIEEKQFVNWLVIAPTELHQRHARNITIE